MFELGFGYPNAADSNQRGSSGLGHADTWAEIGWDAKFALGY